MRNENTYNKFLLKYFIEYINNNNNTSSIHYPYPNYICNLWLQNTKFMFVLEFHVYLRFMFII